MRRREFIALLCGAAIARPLTVRAQQQAMPVIGFLGTDSPDLFAARLRAFRQGLGQAGFVEGRNAAIEYRWAEGQYDRLPTLVADLIRRRVTVIAAGGNAAALAAKAATTTIPIVFGVGFDPVAAELVVSLARPGENLTGVTTVASELGPKRLELLHELVPTAATIIGVLINPTTPGAEALTGDLQAAARSLGLTLHVLHASAEHDFDAVFATLVHLRTGGLVIGADTFFNSRSEQLGALTVRYAIPTIYQSRGFAAAGGLMSYGSSFTDLYGPVAVYIGRILKGEKPADLPVQQAAKVELFINLKTAKALGLTVPPTLRALANEVIE